MGNRVCPFCKIDLSKTKILKDGKNVRVILSNPRLMPGHILVIPKKHVEKISEFNDEEKKELFDTLIEFQGKILQKGVFQFLSRARAKGFF